MPAVVAAGDGLEQAVAAVRAALPDVRLEIAGSEVEVLADDPARALEAEVLLRVALAGEGVTGVRTTRARRSAPPAGR
jgi:hypothetical protein